MDNLNICNKINGVFDRLTAEEISVFVSLIKNELAAYSEDDDVTHLRNISEAYGWAALKSNFPVSLPGWYTSTKRTYESFVTQIIQNMATSRYANYLKEVAV